MGDRIRWWGLRIRVGSLACLLISCCVPCMAMGDDTYIGLQCLALLALFLLMLFSGLGHIPGNIEQPDMSMVMCAAAVVAWSSLMAAVLSRLIARGHEARKVLVAFFSVVCAVSVVGVFLANDCLFPLRYVAVGKMFFGSYLWAISLFGLAAAECLDGCCDTGQVPSAGGSVPDRVPPVESSFGRSDSE